MPTILEKNCCGYFRLSTCFLQITDSTNPPHCLHSRQVDGTPALWNGVDCYIHGFIFCLASDNN